MPEHPSDEAFAQHVLKAGLLTESQLQAALREQADAAGRGQPIALPEVLIRQGLLTPPQRENIDRKLQAQKEDARRLGPYRILRKLGEGGMGAVYLAEDGAGARWALKVLPKVAARDEDAVRRFMREVDSARKLEHANIVRAGERGEDRGFHYYVMEYVEGETLGARLKREGALAPAEAARVVLQVAHGLEYAHDMGFIHRDVKPDNLIVTREGVAKILDMGLSKNIDEAQSFRTVTGVALGTPHYIAPEQARGDKGIDGRADIYSLGATYYHLVTGETPFQGRTAIELISQHLNQQIPDPRDVRDGIPDGVAHVIRNMMAKKPQDRYRDCAELITDLDLVSGGKNPSSQALEAARSAVALPMAREARERFRAQLRRQRPGTHRATARSRWSAAALLAGGVAAAALVAAWAVAMGGGSRPPVASKAPLPEISPPPLPVEPAEDPRTANARRAFERARELETASPSDPAAIQRAYAEARFAAEGTPILALVQEAFRTFQERRAREPAKAPDPGPVALPSPAPADPAPNPTALPSAPPVPPPAAPPGTDRPAAPAPALPGLWKVLTDNRAMLVGKPVPLRKPGFEGAQCRVKGVTEKELIVELALAGGGTAELREPAETLAEELLRDLLKKAAGTITPDVEAALGRLAGDRERARADAEHAKTLEAARGRMARKDWRRAAAILEEALRVRPGDAEARKLLAETEGQLGPAPSLKLDLGGGISIDLLYVKPGAFTMGSTEAPTEPWQKDERPSHRVDLSRGYYLGKHEVTRGQFAAFVRATGYQTDAEREGRGRCWINGGWQDVAGARWQSPSPFSQTDEHPVILVSWNDARAFCEWAARRSGREIHLPTEAEWEYACRAGTATRWSHGDAESGMEENGWLRSNSGLQTQPVGRKKPNAWGFHDMHGSVWEWCQDGWGPYGGDVTDPQGVPGSPDRCLRGGSWINDPIHCRSSFRVGVPPSNRGAHYGFRVAAR